MKRRIAMPWLLALALLAGQVQPLLAGDRPASRRAMSFLQLGAGPRAYALGEAFTGLADDVTALSWNPGGLAQLSDPEILFMHNQWISNIKQEYLAGTYPVFGGMAAGQVSFLNSDIQLRRDQDGVLTGDGFRPYSLMGGLAYGRSLDWGFSAGASVNYAREQLDDAVYQTVFFDLGALYRTPGAWWSLGAAVQNLGLAVAGYSLPLTLRAGGSARFFSDQLNLNLDVARTVPGWFRYSLGAEFWYRNLFAVRAGYLIRPEFEGLDRISGLRAGLGFNLQGYQLDYALIPQGDLGWGHRASFTYFFGCGRALASEKAALIQTSRERGQAALKNQAWAEAVDAFQKVLAFLPLDADAQAGLRKARDALRQQEQEQEIRQRFTQAKKFGRAGQVQDAMDEYQRILLLDEGNQRAAQALARTRKTFHSRTIAEYMRKGRQAYKVQKWVDALQAWQAVLAIDKKHAKALKMLDKTRKQLAKGGKGYKDPRIKKVYLSGLWKFEKGDYCGAIDDWSRVLEIASGHKQARKYLREAIRLRDAKVKQLLQSGDQYLKQEDLIRSVRSWRNILELSPRHAPARQRLRKNNDQIQAQAKKLYLKGIEVYTHGRYKQSIAYWRDVLTLEPDYTGAKKNINKAREKIKATQ